jgi:nucleotide-binding universal stress UspA family protein
MALRVIHLCPAARLTLLYVIDKLVVVELVRFSKRDEKEVEAEMEEQGHRYLELGRQEADGQGVPADCQIRKGDPFEEIIAAANSLPADLIIMGHTGRRGTSRVLLGSVTERVLDYAPCPVLVMK